MSAVIEMHDSQCMDIELDGTGGGSVLLNAYVHRSDGDGDPLAVPHEGGMQRFRFKFDGILLDGVLGDLPSYLYDGSLVVGKETQDGILNFPAVYMESVCLRMTFSNDGRTVAVTGSGLSIVVESEFEFVENVDFSS